MEIEKEEKNERQYDEDSQSFSSFSSFHSSLSFDNLENNFITNFNSKIINDCRNINIKNLNKNKKNNQLFIISSSDPVTTTTNNNKCDNNQVVNLNENCYCSSGSNNDSGIGSIDDINLSTQQFNKIILDNVNDVLIGSKTVYQCPVIINQILMTKSLNNVNSENNFNNDNDDRIMRSSGEENNKPTRCDLIKKYKRLILCGIVFLSVIVITVSTSLFIPDDNDINDINDANRVIPYITRVEWKALPPTVPLIAFNTTPFRVIISHTASDGCTTKKSCCNRVRFIQKYHQNEQQFDDIGYNFVIGGDGYVYEGRGWDYIGSHTLHYNNGSLGISFIGDYTEYKPSNLQLLAVQWIINESIKLNKLKSNYLLYGACQLRPTKSPGKALMDVIKTWSHWTDIINQF